MATTGSKKTHFFFYFLYHCMDFKMFSKKINMKQVIKVLHSPLFPVCHLCPLRPLVCRLILLLTFISKLLKLPVCVRLCLGSWF